MGESNQRVQVQCAWLKMLGTGNVTTNQPGIGPGGPATVGSESVPVDIPMYFVEGEEAATDLVDDLSINQGYDTRKTITAALSCHPNPSGGAFYGGAVYGTGKYSPIAWFTSRASMQLTTRSFRIGFIDDPYTRQNRGPNVHIAAIQLELGPSLGSRQ